ncbi:glycoside hydrolase family 15 protein [Actinoplanes sp. TBRC 11911]|uniref:glycoside hydrolase family 15 protein n=1 Tax=Actinoplanes sp. TBRC 11911 TaxID=2729386 RepID=UPI00145FC1B0|nr:glycoside hydrolase family 15 protein [Actinoplanes sp. TBRC 11911]NMO54675.1 glycoside hydrolase family 15 protein [Actinoplanes sp. TBRC 11911]
MPGRIEDYAVIGDLHTAALVGRDGSIDWLCLPRFDSPACFAALLHDESAGHWRIAPASGGVATRRRYRDDTMILETEWETPSGSVRVVDLMPPRDQTADVVRIVEGLSGSVPMTMQLLLRFDYGRIRPWVFRRHGELVAIAGPDAVWLRTGVRVHGENPRTAEFTVSKGQSVSFVLSYQQSHLPRPEPIDPQHALETTGRVWRHWIDRCDYKGLYSGAVRRALLTLKTLTYAPTGGILAAATTSLPEQLGGPRNWDYRYCWLRDSTYALQALLGTGFETEAKAWREWLLRAVAGDPADLQIMYGLDGTRRIPEYSLDWLSGYEGSTPVRAGNAAAGQFQLDVWGEVLDSLHLSREAGIAATDAGWDFQLALLDQLEHTWREPDNGIWEVRGSRRHFVHSKFMAWVGFDRAVRGAERHGLPGPADRWRSIRDEIHAEVCEKGFDTDRNTFTQSYGSTALDAAVLLMPRVGFLPYEDPRVIGTVEAIQRELTQDGFLLRYRADDGLPGAEGVFLICSFWLVEALHGIGRKHEATELFERLLHLRNDVGLLSEEYDPVSARQLGNTPQAFSLLGLVNSARTLSGAAPR